MTSRIHEYPLETPARVAYAVRWLGAGVAAGGGAGFLLSLGAAITLNEAVLDVWNDADLDPLSRSLIPLLFVTLGVGLLVFALGNTTYKWLLGRQLARASLATPSLVPPHWQREVITGPAPLTGASGTLWTVFGLTAFIALAFFAILGDTSDEEVPFVAGVGVGALLLAAALIATQLLVVSRAKRRWSTVVQSARSAWGRRTVRETEDVDRSRRPRGEKIGPSGAVRALSAITIRLITVGAGAVVVGSAVGFAGVFLRQPCRGCDERSYDSFGEAVIDNLALAGSLVTALGLVVLVLAGLLATAEGILVDKALTDAVSGVDAQWRPDGAMLQDRLAGLSLAEWYALLLAGVGSILGTAALAIAAIDFPVDETARDTALAIGLAMMGAAPVLAYIGVGYNLRLRSELRERWAPADVPRPRSGRARQR